LRAFPSLPQPSMPAPLPVLLVAVLLLAAAPARAVRNVNGFLAEDEGEASDRGRVRASQGVQRSEGNPLDTIDSMVRVGHFMMATRGQCMLGKRVSVTKDRATKLWHYEVPRRREWEQLREQVNVTDEAMDAIANSPEEANKLVHALMGILITRDDLQFRCTGTTWSSGKPAWLSDSPTLKLIDASMAKVVSEVDLAIQETVVVLRQLADIVVTVLLHDVCFLLAVNSSSAERCASAAEQEALLELIQSLEGPAASGDLVPNVTTMHQLVTRSEDAKFLARRIADFAAVLQSIVAGAAGTGRPSLTSDLAGVRDLVWACGLLTSAASGCSPLWLSVRVPADTGDGRDVVQILGSRTATALLLYWPDGEAYPDDDVRGWLDVRWLAGYSVAESPNRRGAPGGLGRAAGATEEIALKQRLLYWDPSVAYWQFYEELCAWQKFRYHGKNCHELERAIFDIKVAKGLGAMLKAMDAYVVSGGLAATTNPAHFLAGVLGAGAHTLPVPGAGAASLAGGHMLSALGIAIPSSVAAPALLGLGVFAFISGGVSLLYRRTGLQNGQLPYEDCLCGLVGVTMRTDAAEPSRPTPSAQEVGLGYDLCKAGLGQCPTQSVMFARYEADTLMGILEDVLSRLLLEWDGMEPPGAGISESVEALRGQLYDVYCQLRKLLAETAQFCEERRECEGEVLLPDGARADGREMFGWLCKDFASKAEALMPTADSVMHQGLLAAGEMACPGRDSA